MTSNPKRLQSWLIREKKALNKIESKGEYLRGYEHAIDNVIDKLPKELQLPSLRTFPKPTVGMSSLKAGIRTMGRVISS